MNKLLLLLLLTICPWAQAQRTVDFVIPFAQGGTADRLAIILISHMKIELASYNITPVLSYRPGGGSTLGANSVARADKLQILLAPNAVVTAAIVNPGAANYNLSTDFVPLEYIGHIPMLLVVNSASKIRTIQDLQRECHQRPISYGSAGIGSATHIASDIVMNTLKCKSIHVPYKGVGPAISDLQGQHIEVVTDFITSIRTYIDAATFRPLLSVGKLRYGDLPSMIDIGYIDYDFYNWFILAVNASAPAAEIEQIRQAMHRMIRRQDLHEQLTEAGLRDIAKPISSLFLTAEHAKFKKIINRTSVNAR